MNDSGQSSLEDVTHAPTAGNSARTPLTRGARLLRIGAAVSVALLIGVGGVVVAKKSGSADASPAGAQPARDVPHIDGKVIRFSPEFRARSGIEIAPAELASLKPTISVTGTVTFDPEAVAAIGARISGRVRRVFKYPGDPVKKGDVLAELESAELGQAQAAVLGARAHAEAAAANETREHQLAEARISSQRDYELARATMQAAKAELFASEQKVRALSGTSGSGEVGILSLTTPIDGKVVELHVSRGQSVEPSYTAFKVADIRTLWIELAVFERELGHVRAGDAVEISPQTNLTAVLKGKVAHVGDVIDLETRSAPVRVEVDNDEETLRPGQSVVAKIHTQTAPQALLLPREAVTTVDGKPTLFVASDETSVEVRTIVLGSGDGNKVEIKQGLNAQERVIVKGVFALKSEVFR